MLQFIVDKSVFFSRELTEREEFVADVLQPTDELDSGPDVSGSDRIGKSCGGNLRKISSKAAFR